MQKEAVSIWSVEAETGPTFFSIVSSIPWSLPNTYKVLNMDLMIESM